MNDYLSATNSYDFSSRSVTSRPLDVYQGYEELKPLAPHQQLTQTQDIDPHWLLQKINRFKPRTILQTHQSINWFRTRRSRETSESYLHSGEELIQKKRVRSLFTQMKRDKGMKQQLESVLDKKPVRDLIQTAKFVKPLQDPNPFKRTLGDWTQNQEKAFNSTRRYLSTRQSIHQSQTPQPDPQELFRHRDLDLHKFILASMKKVEVCDDSLNAASVIEGKVHQLQRSNLHSKIKSDFSKGESTVRCVNNFIKLFKKDCQPVLRETNEFYQMKKLQAKRELTKTPVIKIRMANNDSTPLMTGQDGYNRYGGRPIQNKGGESQELDALLCIDKIKSPKILMQEYQHQLRHSKHPVEHKYGEKLDAIINQARQNGRSQVRTAQLQKQRTKTTTEALLTTTMGGRMTDNSRYEQFPTNDYE